MLEGTDLYSAYAPLMPQEEPVSSHQFTQQNQPATASPKPSPTTVQEEPVQTSAQQQSYPYDANQYNQYYSNEQKLLAIINELKKKQSTQSQQQTQSSSYFDKLAAKKKDVYKFLHSAFIIVFALAVHFLIHHYFKHYLDNNEVSFERELLLRILYPIGILFVAWNIMLLLKS